MKRSEVNRALRGMEAMLEQHRFALPPFCHYIRLSKSLSLRASPQTGRGDPLPKYIVPAFFADFQQKVWAYRHAYVSTR